MTRDEALDFYKKGTLFEPIYQTIEKHINNIFDDFESRTCENCINDYQCDIQDKLELQDYSLNFGCTFFRKRELKNEK